MSVFVKICGLTTREDFQRVAALQPDAVGFVFWERSKRNVHAAEVATWHTAGTGPLRVGVFVDAAPEAIIQAAQTARLDVVQLHGFQSLENAPDIFPMIGKIRAAGSRVWMVRHLTGTPDMPAPPPAGLVDAYVLDSYSAQSPGGTGQVCDWTQAAAFARQSATRVILAGGLHPENVAEAIRQVRPWGVDVSSGVERAPGKKDLAQVEAFIRHCRVM